MKVACICGVFDLFGVDQLVNIQEAKAYCDKLVIGVFSDEIVNRRCRKKSINSCQNRMKIVESIYDVDYVLRLDKYDENGVFCEGEIVLITGQSADRFIKIIDNGRMVCLDEEVIEKEIMHFRHTVIENSSLLIRNAMERNYIEKKKYNIGYTTGCFDLFHVGHLNILHNAKELCEYLIVGISTDELVEQYKHHRPTVPFGDRMAIVSNIKYVDKVVAQFDLDKSIMWDELRFDVLFHGSDYKGSDLFNRVSEKLASKGVDTVFFDYTKGISSTSIKSCMSMKS